MLINGDVRHGGSRRGAMPMLFTGRNPDHVSGPNFFNGSAPALHPPAAGGDNEILTQRVGVLECSRAGFEGDADAQCAGRSIYLEEGIDAHVAGKPIGRSFSGGLRTRSHDVHAQLLP